VLVVALTGGIGSGKSLAGEYFADLGAQVIDFDQIARDVVERGSDGFDEIVLRFGDDILSSGEIDRSKLASIVFKDASARADLEVIIHPRIQEAFHMVVAELEHDQILIAQIPLLAQSKHDYKFDLVVTVNASEEIRRNRLLDRGLKDYQITERFAAQSTDADRTAIADFVITNEGTSDQLLRQVENLYEERLYPARMGI
jgi:dephospho-CoA kinase